MGIYTNGQLIYGFVDDIDVENLFEALYGENEEGNALEELHRDLQKKYHISLSSVGYEGVDLLSAFSACANAKGFDVRDIKDEDLAKTEEYRKNILDFLTEAGIAHPEQYTPGWHILAYMD